MYRLCMKADTISMQAVIPMSFEGMVKYPQIGKVASCKPPNTETARKSGL
ncbi:MAG: hypothetical protein SOT69_00365 [Mesosutterella sp.]|nr:hypothetical protein [Mesosutterella sp.]